MRAALALRRRGSPGKCVGACTALISRFLRGSSCSSSDSAAACSRADISITALPSMQIGDERRVRDQKPLAASPARRPPPRPQTAHGHGPARSRGQNRFSDPTLCNKLKRRTSSVCAVATTLCSMQHTTDCMDLPLHRRADSTFRISLKMQNADGECRMQNPAQNVYSVCAACRMQDAGRRIGPKMDSSAYGAGCRMQNAGCKLRPKESRCIRWGLLGAAHSFEPDSASCICILHSASGARHLALGPILHSAFCICILHRVQFTALGLILHSAVSPPEERQRRDAARRSHIAAPGRA